jgi:hypothetical protein
MTDEILCEKCMVPLGRNLITLPFAVVNGLRRRIAELEGKQPPPPLFEREPVVYTNDGPAPEQRIAAPQTSRSPPPPPVFR